MAWMAWTWPTAVFFSAIALALVCMTLLELNRPTESRRGFLPMPTTRGDRFFISLLSAGFLHLAWLGLTSAPVWIASVLALLLACLILRWG